MKGFPKKIATGNDLYNCLSLVQAGKLPANDLSAAIEAVEKRQYITVPILQIGEDRKTVVIRPCAEAKTGVKVKNTYTTTIKESQCEQAATVLAAFEKIAKGLFDTLDGAFGSVESEADALLSGGENGEVTEGEEVEELMIVTLSRAVQEGENALSILAQTSPFDVLGITADELKSIKGVLKNYEQISNK